MKALMKKDKKGFTLVEVIVVLVILAILAAILVPTLTGYIDKAKENVIVAETRSVVMAAQTLASESYGKTGTPAASVADAQALSEVTGTITTITLGGTNSAQVTKVVYSSGGYTCTYTYADGKGSYSTAKS